MAKANNTALPAPETDSIEVAAARLGIGRTSAYQRAAEGELAPGVPVIKIGRRYVVSRAALDKLLAPAS